MSVPEQAGPELRTTPATAQAVAHFVAEVLSALGRLHRPRHFAN